MQILSSSMETITHFFSFLCRLSTYMNDILECFDHTGDDEYFPFKYHTDSFYLKDH